MKKVNLTHKVAAVITAAVTFGPSVQAFAADDNLGTIGDNIVASASNIPKMISTVAYIAGIGMGTTGIFKLKQHVDSPGNTPMKDGLIRLAAGGGLLALPYMTEAMVGTVGESGSQGVDFNDGAFKMQ